MMKGSCGRDAFFLCGTLFPAPDARCVGRSGKSAPDGRCSGMNATPHPQPPAGAPVSTAVATPPRLAAASAPKDAFAVEKAFLLDVFRQLRPILLDVVASTTAINILALALPLALLQMYDRIIPNSAESTLMLLVLGVGIAVLLDSLIRMMRSYLTGWIGAHFDHMTSCQAMQTMINARYDEFGRFETGQHMERLAAIPTLREFYSGQALLIMLDLPFAFAYLFLIWFIGGWIVTVPLLMIAMFSLSTLQSGRALRKAMENRTQADDRRLNFLIEVLGGVHTVKSMAMEAQMVRRYERLQATCADANTQVAMHSAEAMDTANFHVQFTTLLLAAFGAVLVIKGAMTVGGLAATTMLAGRAIQPLQRAAGIWTRFQAIRIAAGRLSRLFDLPQDNQEGRPEFPPIRGRISLEGVSFRYGKGLPLLIRDAHMIIEAGEMIAITGDNASGKTTLLWLMQGALPPSDGIVRIDDLNIRDFNVQSLCAQMAYLPQHGVLFDGTIMDNLTVFRPELADEAVLVARQMGLDNIVSHMPLGYETRIGDSAADFLPRGINQRIAIARALVTKPKILLFDEANTAMDSAGDTLLRQFLEKIKGRQTVVMVTHRPSMLSLAHRVFSLREGTLVPVERRTP